MSNRVTAAGVQHGLVNPEEQMGLDLARRAQIAALMSAGGGGGQVPQGEAPMVQPQSGAGEYSPDAWARYQRGKAVLAQQGQQDIDLQKQKGADYLGAVKEQMAPANAGVDQRAKEWSDMSGRRGLEDEGLRNQNFIQGAQANVLRQALPTDMGGQGPMSDQGGGTAGAERLLQIMQGKNPDEQKVQTQLMQEQLKMLQAQNTEKQGLIGGAGVQEAYGQAAPMLQGDLARMKNFIRSNNWSIAGNQEQLRSLYSSILNKAAQMKMPPAAYRIFEEEVKNTMRDALAENGAIFESAGSDTTRQNFGL